MAFKNKLGAIDFWNWCKAICLLTAARTGLIRIIGVKDKGNVASVAWRFNRG